MVPQEPINRIIVLKTVYKQLLSEMNVHLWLYFKELCENVNHSDIPLSISTEKWFLNLAPALFATISFHYIKLPESSWLFNAFRDLNMPIKGSATGRGIKMDLWDQICSNFQSLWSRFLPDQKLTQALESSRSQYAPKISEIL